MIDHSQFHNLDNAIALDRVIHMIELNHYKQEKNEIKKMMWELCMNELKQMRNSYASQGGVSLIETTIIEL